MIITRRTFGLGASGLMFGSLAAPFVRRAGAAGPVIRIGVINSMSGALAAYAQEARRGSTGLLSPCFTGGQGLKLFRTIQ